MAATTGVANGDTLRVDTGGTTESVTVTNVGSQARSTTLSAAAAAGATNVKLASVTGLAAGDTLNLDSGAAQESRTIASVGTSGANGTGVTLTTALGSAHAAGAAVQDPGAGITFTPALSSAHAAGATVIDPGTGVTLSAPLGSAHAAGAAVTTTPGAVTGDRNGNNGVGTDGSRADNFTLSAPGTFGNTATQIQGGERFQLITLTTPGTVQLSAAGIHLRHPNSAAGDYQGHFLSSDDALNRIWYEGVYTDQTDEVPIGALPNADRAGDPRRRKARPAAVERRSQRRRPQRVRQHRLGRERLGLHQGHDRGVRRRAWRPTGRSAARSPTGRSSRPAASFYSESYSTYWVIDLASYYLYSGDMPSRNRSTRR